MMHWLLQENMAHEKGWDDLVSTLERFSIPYSFHKVVPFVGELIPDPILENDNVICMGSYSMRHYAKKHNLNPGVFDIEGIDFSVQRWYWKHNMLNFDSQIVKFKDIEIYQPMFLRPVEDNKFFAGNVFDPKEFKEWQKKVLDNVDSEEKLSLSGETVCQVSIPKKIYSEYRFWVIGTEIITASQYKRGDQVIYSNNVDQRFYDYVMTLIHPFSYFERNDRMWSPERAYVLDVCETDQGIKVVEINTLNSAGFYAADVPKLVMALEGKFNV